MNRERMLGIFQNLLQEMEEAKIINTDGNNKIMRVLLDNTCNNYEVNDDETN